MSRHWLRCAILDHIRTTSSWLVRGLVYLCRFSCVRFSIHDYFLILFTECSVQRAAKAIYKQVIHDYGDTLRVLVPSVLYTIQNTLLYVAISNLNAVTYQILYQFKIFTTAIFMVILLGRKLSAAKWIALVMLCLGIVLSQLNPETVSSSPPSNRTASSPFAGLCAIVFATVSSGFAGVYFEKILKGTAPSIWMRNIQLAIEIVSILQLRLESLSGLLVSTPLIEKPCLITDFFKATLLSCGLS
ncbi:unnamed protein product [Dicrocoelium dendriticum]|nr:unnamed protein product [Dicrocoelium dendriticum]